MFPPQIPPSPPLGMPGQQSLPPAPPKSNVPQPEPEHKPEDTPENKKRWDEFRQRITACKTYRKKLISNWAINIDYRRGKPFASGSDDDNIAVNMDWSLTKTKMAALYSQNPDVHVNHPPESVDAPWVPLFERKLNDTLVSAGIESAMYETLPDCINAAGMGIALVSYESITEDKEVPSIDMSTLPPQIMLEILTKRTINGKPIPMETVPTPIDHRYTIRRISPSDFLWPVDFTGSDFDNAPWLGHTGRLPWAEAAVRFHLDEKDKDKFSTEEATFDAKLIYDYDKERTEEDNKVGYDEIFYREFQYDTKSKSYDVIHHLVFLHGKQKPVIDEQWKGQNIDDKSRKITGSTKVPIRVLTLTYVTDENIPPSDTAIGRAQVNELNKGRTQINRQRERAISQMWHDVNRMDPTIQQAMMRGTWLNSIPVQGDGSRIIGTLQHPAMPQETFMFDRIAKSDLQEQWTVGANQTGGGEGVETKGEASVIQTNFMTKVGQERARVASFVIGIAQVLGGLLCLYEDSQAFGQGFDPGFSNALTYSILVDSTILLDSNQRLERLNNFVNTYAKSGLINMEPILKEIAALSGLDPNTAIIKPEPQKPEMPNISLRLTGGKDMMNPLLLAFLIKSGQAPESELIEQAKKIIQQAVIEVQPPAPPPGMPPVPVGPDGNPLPPEGQLPQPPPPAIGDANPDLSIMPTINKRANEPQG